MLIAMKQIEIASNCIIIIFDLRLDMMLGSDFFEFRLLTPPEYRILCHSITGVPSSGIWLFRAAVYFLLFH